MIPILSTFIFLIINLTMQHHLNHCSLSTAGEKMEHSILQTSSMGSSLTNDKDTDSTACAWTSPALLARADGMSCTQLMSEQAGSSLSQSMHTQGRYSSEVQTSIDSSFPLAVTIPSKSLQNYNSRQLFEEGWEEQHIAYLLYHFCDLWCKFCPPFASQLPPVTVKDQPYEVLRLLNAFQLGSSSIR